MSHDSRPDHHPNPLQPHVAALQQAWTQLGDSIKHNVHQFQRNAQRPLQELGAHAAGFVRHVQREVAARLPSPAAPQPALASVSGALSRAASSRPQALFDLAFNPEEIKMRLSGIPVFAVVNQKNEFVLVSGEDATRQLGLFFFAKEDAEGLIATIKEQNAKLGRSAHVMMTSMDAVYEFTMAPRDQSGTEGVTFRFMPEGAQVEHALELYRHAGIPSTAFTGVPLFQAEGLTVKSDATRYTPLFFSKADLDLALGDAYLTKDSDAQAAARSKADRARAELAVAEAEAGDDGVDSKARRAAAKRAEAAKVRLQKYEAKLAEVTAKKKMPRVDVGALEEVIVKMEQDEAGEWGDVVFIPAGALDKGANQQQQQTEEVKGKGKKK